MAEIDTRPLGSVQAALTLFERRSDQSRFSSPDRNEREIDVVMRELASCKLQLEVKESESKQATLKIAALHKATRDLSEIMDREALERILEELSSEIAHMYLDKESFSVDRQKVQSRRAQEETKNHLRFVDAEVATVDFGSVNFDDRDMNGAGTGNMTGKQKLQAGMNSGADADFGFAAEIVKVISKDDDGEFYTKEMDKLDDGYVLVAKKAGDGDTYGKVDSLYAEISDLRFSLEEAIRRAELAEEALEKGELTGDLEECAQQEIFH